MIKKMKADMLVARRNKDSKAVASYAFIISEIENIGKNAGNRETTNDEAIALIKKMVARNEDNLQYTKDKDAILSEINMLKSYLPEMVSDSEVKAYIDINVCGGVNNIGQMMGLLKKKYGQTVNMKVASAYTKEILG